LNEATSSKRHRVLLAGSTGFVGCHAHPALVAAGFDVLSATRAPERAQRAHPDRAWVKMDVDRPETIDAALRGCDQLLYLVHHMGGGADYARSEERAALAVREAAERAGLERLVYLGGVEPSGEVSTHLASRLQTGRTLRGGATPTIELRAAMIVGSGSASWQIVRDLAARLPAMVLPRWLNNRSSPVAIDDVVAAILWALRDAPRESRWYDVPGPEILSHRRSIERAAAALGKRPAMVEVPVVTPRLSSYWIALVTRIGLDLARELVEGLQSDLVPRGDSVWDAIDGHEPMTFDEAARHALADETFGSFPAPPTRARLEALGRLFAIGGGG
jgi:uncharacterized protein YbjT (DUF2867 family)